MSAASQQLTMDSTVAVLVYLRIELGHVAGTRLVVSNDEQPPVTSV